MREIEFLAEADVSLIGDRRSVGPPGTRGGASAAHGENTLVHAGGEREPLAGQQQLRAGPGDRVEVRTPGGGGWGKVEGD